MPIFEGLLTGVAASIATDKTKGLVNQATGVKPPHLEEHGECVHADLHDIRDALQTLVGNSVTQSLIRRIFILQPGVLAQMENERYQRTYNVALLPANTNVLFEVIGVGQFTLPLVTGWNILNMPDDARWGLPVGAPANVSVVYCATNELFGHQI